MNKSYTDERVLPIDKHNMCRLCPLEVMQLIVGEKNLQKCCKMFQCNVKSHKQRQFINSNSKKKKKKLQYIK